MTVQITLSLYETHLQLIDEVVAAGNHGKNREEVLRATLVEHVRYLLGGGTPHDPAPWTTVQVKRPSYGNPKSEAILRPGEGKALPVLKGEVLHMTQLVGGQCIDFNGYNLYDYKEWLDCGFNRQRGIVTGPGTVVWSGSPRGRPMYVILDASESLDQFYEGHRCNSIILEREYGFAHHASCQDAFAEAIREYGMTEDDVHDSYNLWMNTYLDERGRRIYAWNRAQKDDWVDLLALFDTLSVPVCCPGELNACNSYDPHPVRIEIMEATPDTLELVERVYQEWGQLKMQRGPDDFKIKEIRAQRELECDPEYRPDFLPMPQKHSLEVEASSQDQALLQGLVQDGNYGTTEPQAMLVAFLRWYDQNRMERRYMRLDIGK